jgi:hypothetical protein
MSLDDFLFFDRAILLPDLHGLFDFDRRAKAASP